MYEYFAQPVKVTAYLITEIRGREPNGNVRLTLENGDLVEALPDMTVRMQPQVGDYWVIQEDGYTYLNPRAVFQKKYAPTMAESIYDAPRLAALDEAIKEQKIKLRSNAAPVVAEEVETAAMLALHAIEATAAENAIAAQTTEAEVVAATENPTHAPAPDVAIPIEAETVMDGIISPVEIVSREGEQPKPSQVQVTDEITSAMVNTLGDTHTQDAVVARYGDTLSKKAKKKQTNK